MKYLLLSLTLLVFSCYAQENYNPITIVEHPSVQLEANKSILAKVKHEGRYGFINYYGEMVIPIEYDLVGDFSDGLVWVWKDGKAGVLNYLGEEVIPLKYELYNENYYDGVRTEMPPKYLNGVTIVTDSLGREAWFNWKGQQMIPFKKVKLPIFDMPVITVDLDNSDGKRYIINVLGDTIDYMSSESNVNVYVDYLVEGYALFLLKLRDAYTYSYFSYLDSLGQRGEPKIPSFVYGKSNPYGPDTEPKAFRFRNGKAIVFVDDEDDIRLLDSDLKIKPFTKKDALNFPDFSFTHLFEDPYTVVVDDEEFKLCVRGTLDGGTVGRNQFGDFQFLSGRNSAGIYNWKKKEWLHKSTDDFFKMGARRVRKNHYAYDFKEGKYMVHTHFGWSNRQLIDIYDLNGLKKDSVMLPDRYVFQNFIGNSTFYAIEGDDESNYLFYNIESKEGHLYRNKRYVSFGNVGVGYFKDAESSTIVFQEGRDSFLGGCVTADGYVIDIPNAHIYTFVNAREQYLEMKSYQSKLLRYF